MKWVLIIMLYKGGVVAVPMASESACRAALPQYASTMMWSTNTSCLNTETGEVK